MKGENTRVRWVDYVKVIACISIRTFLSKYDKIKYIVSKWVIYMV